MNQYESVQSIINLAEALLASVLACTLKSAGVSCDEYQVWPNPALADCGGCKGLVMFRDNSFTTCSEYCASFGHECFYAAEDTANDCVELTGGQWPSPGSGACSFSVPATTSDFLCGCLKASSHATGCAGIPSYSVWGEAALGDDFGLTQVQCR